ncbi:developmental regulator medusa [Ephemerocybe angulata]|uniref:Developmental regulator medusa n=1 Tax=Ephemerocybe angulata TaxID=980116 RepID=A0A8H6M8Q1_9AGAR|nr:developmental regulator medusa [Tulosesus angulatus]
MSSPTIPDISPGTAVSSSVGIIHVLGYTPQEGEHGVPITVRIHFRPELADAMYVRLVVGHKAVATKFDDDRYSSSKVMISVQALNDENTILDSVVFGEFSYWSPTCTPDRISGQAPSSKIEGIATRRRGATMSHVPSSAAERASLTQPKLRIHRRVKTQSIVRSKHSSLPHDHAKLVPHTPVLEMITPLNTICTGWNQTEYNAGRRLVRFSKVQDGRKLIVSCEPIRQEDYCEADTVISCIYREEVDSCFITSVDVIYLLERLTNGEFPVEEKNRIRRNLEGLRPTTVSKHKPGFGDFFQRIMEFPDPKPRNIEKDLKVFDWNSLGQALEKILSKYSIYVNPEDREDSTSTSGGSPVSEPSPLDSPELATMHLAYPPAPDDDLIKFEAPANEIHLMPDGSLQPDVFVSAVDTSSTTNSSSSDSSSTFFPATFIMDPTTANTTSDIPEIMPNIWQNELKGNTLPSMDNLSSVLASYETIDPLENVHGYSHEDNNNDPMDFGIYDNFTFPGMVGDHGLTVDPRYNV